MHATKFFLQKTNQEAPDLTTGRTKTVNHSNYHTADIYRLMVAETRGTTPNPYTLFALERDLDLGSADAFLICKPHPDTAHV